MRRIKLKRMGKHGQANTEANKKLKELFTEMGVRECKAKLATCLKNNFLSWHHRHPRSWYYQCPELLSDWGEVILICLNCHNRLTSDKKLNEEVFKRLRG